MSVQSLINAAWQYIAAVDAAGRPRRLDESPPLPHEDVREARKLLLDEMAEFGSDSATPVVFSRVLIAVDASEHAMAAVTAGGKLAVALGAAVMLMHVIDVRRETSGRAVASAHIAAAARHTAERLLDEAASLLPAEVQAERRIVEESPAADAIIAAAEAWHADLVVLGTHARGRLARFLLGSTADAVVRKAHCPVLTIAQVPQVSANHHQDASERPLWSVVA
jgi:nucleotide-binding universal stress UspA family protein